MKKIISAILLSSALFFAITPRVHADNDIKMWIDGRYLASATKPYLEDGTTMVPLRFISERLGFKVDWDNTVKQITITDSDKRVRLAIDNPKVYINGQEKTLVKAPVVKNGVTYVPIRAISEMMGKEVGWDQEKKTVIIGINYPKIPDGSTEKLISPEEALKIAMKIKKGYLTRFELEGKKYKIELETREEEYNFVINAFTGDVDKHDTQKNTDVEDNWYLDETDFSEKNPQNKKLTEKEAEKKALEEVNGKILKSEYSKEDNKYIFEIEVRSGVYRIEVDAKSGEILTKESVM